MDRMDVLFDMETFDPDDALTLCFLVSHPLVNLRAVTVMPGADDQIGLVRAILLEAGLRIPVGAQKIHHPKKCVSQYYYDWMGDFSPASPDDTGVKVINETIRTFPDIQILTGAPVKNFAGLDADLAIPRWVAQGGFAGDNIVPETWRLEKFKGRLTCPTTNFNGDATTAFSMLQNPLIGRRLLVSKNVCHGVVYDLEMHERFRSVKDNCIGLNLVYRGMERFLSKHPNGKKFHDPLAASVLIDESVCEFREVEMYRIKGEWGCELKDETNTYISIKADIDKMFTALTMT